MTVEELIKYLDEEWPKDYFVTGFNNLKFYQSKEESDAKGYKEHFVFGCRSNWKLIGNIEPKG